MEINAQTKLITLKVITNDRFITPDQNVMVPKPTTTLRLTRNDGSVVLIRNGTVPESAGKHKFIPIKRYTYPIFLERARIVHGDKYNYDNVKESDIQTIRSKITIVCNKCSYEWTTAINTHINGANCPECAGRVDWNYDRFLRRAAIAHGNKYNYDRINPNDVRNSKSRVTVICNTCLYEWTSKVKNHIHGARNCPNCAGKIPWNLERFLNQARRIHGDKHDYTRVTSDHIQNVESRVPVTCNSCHYSWTPSIKSHINSESGCMYCNGNAPWTYERFINRAREIHGDKYNYIKVTPDHIQNVESKLPIICNSCNHEWLVTIHRHISTESGCPPCSRPLKYSVAQIQWMETIMESENIDIQHALSPLGEYTIDEIGRVDGFCRETNTVYEYHGDFWHGNPSRYPSDKAHPMIKGKTYGDLYNKTLLRDQRIRELGYNLVVKWETDPVG